MGIILDVNQVSDIREITSRLLIYQSKIDKLKEPQSISKPLAEALLSCRENRRSMKLGQIFNSVLDMYPDGIVVKDIDVMFHPDYKVDVLKILMEARKRKPYSVIWPGRCENGKLIYGEEGYPDYRVYDIGDYDITFVIGGYER
jgi:hypothetical protein